MVPGLVDVLRNPATLQRMWQNAMGMIKKANPAHAVLFFNTRPVLDAEKGVLIVEVDAANAFAANALQKPEVQFELQQCLDAAAGAPVVFRLQKQEGASGGGFAAPASPSVSTPVPAAPAVSAPAPVPAIEPAASVPGAPSAAASGQGNAPGAPSVPVETPPWDQPPVPPTPASAPAPTFQPPVVPASAAAPIASVPTAAAVSAPPAPPAAAPAPQQGFSDAEEASADELNSILAGAFGEGVVFTEE